MAVIHNTTMKPTKLELLAEWLPHQPWFTGPVDGLARAGGFRLDDPADEVGIEFMVVTDGSGEAYLVPMTYRGGPLDGADEALIGTSEHGVLGTRWIYDGEHDPVLRDQLAALLRGEAAAQAQTQSNTADPSVVVKRAGPVTTVQIVRRLVDDAPPPSGGHVTVPWRRPDGSSAQGVVAHV